MAKGGATGKVQTKQKKTAKKGDTCLKSAHAKLLSLEDAPNSQDSDTSENKKGKGERVSNASFVAVKKSPSIRIGKGPGDGCRW